ncbi:MAG: MFS transporter [Chroococcidiopsidaceae cyanobacterium CP_BM_ER_R8_30]|nr:MFS transporter [Chroococcidiopsidaceae cyanobacterium CP_BM_ER_R8_30]
MSQTDRSPESDRKTDLLSQLDNLPWSSFHTSLVIALGLGWALDSFEINIIGSVLALLTKEWHLTAIQGSYAVSAWVFGILLGALVFGYLADRLGRKKMFLFTLFWYAGFSVLTTFAWDYPSFLALRFLTALGVGGEYSAVTATMGEFIPKKYRGKTDSLILAGFPLGGVLSSLVALLLVKYLPTSIAWRVGFGLGGLLAVSGLWARQVIPESPRWLIHQGQREKAEAIVHSIEAIVAKEKLSEFSRSVMSITLEQPPSDKSVEWQAKFNTPLRLALASALNFSQAAIVYGMTALITLVLLPSIHIPATAMPRYVFIGNFAALAGGILVAIALDKWGRRSALLFGYVLSTIGLIYLYFAGDSQQILLGYSLVQFSITWAYIAAYILTAEILPTLIRGTGLGLSVAVGRLGAFFAPLLLTQVFSSTRDPKAALLVLLIMVLPGPISALLWYLRGVETKNRALERTAGDFV